jgi:hypothetical protein
MVRGHYPLTFGAATSAKMRFMLRKTMGSDLKIQLPDQSRLTLRKLKRLNRKFWLPQSELTVRRISDRMIYDVASSSMKSEAIRGVPLN